MKYGTHDWEWAGINFLHVPLAFSEPLMVMLSVDIFEYSDEQLDQMFAVMLLTPWHKYQVPTKQPRRMLEYFEQEHGVRARWEIDSIATRMGHNLNRGTAWPLSNVWLGVTVESQKTANERIPLLQHAPAAVRFLSCEPLLEDIAFVIDHDGIWENLLTGEVEGHGKVSPSIDWVIVGGKSGSGARPCNIKWIKSVVNQCKTAGVPCFVKQLGSKCHCLSHGYTGKGKNPEEWLEDLRVREYPRVN